MGLFAPVAAYLASRVGTRRAMTIGLALIGAFGVAPGNHALRRGSLVLLTWPVGIGMGLGNALAPIAVKERFAKRPATGTGVYTTGIQIGSASSAALAVPLAGWFGGWRGAADRVLVHRSALARRLGRADVGGRASRCARRDGAAPSLAQSHGVAPRRDLRADGLRRTTGSTRGSPMPTPSAGGARGRRACSSR